MIGPVVLSVVLALAPQGAPAQAGTPAQAPAVAVGPWELSSDVGAFLIVVKADKASAFDAALQRLKAAFAQPGNPSARKAQALGWRVLKSTEAPTDGTITYLWLIDPAVSKVSYDPLVIMRELLPAEAQSVFDQMKDAWVSATRIGLKDLVRMGGAGG